MPDRWRTLWERMRPASTVWLGLIAAPAFLAACGVYGDSVPVRATATGDSSISLEPTQDASSTDTPPTDTPADGPTHGSPEFPEGTAPQTSRSSGGAPIVFTDVRVAEHERFDRIVLEFSGTGTPGWAVNYVDEVSLEGSGDIVRLGRDSILDIYASNTTWPASDYYSGPQRLRAENGGLTEVYVVGTFEGSTQLLAGIDGPRAPFRVVALTHPSRLVIDVVDDSVG